MIRRSTRGSIESRGLGSRFRGALGRDPNFDNHPRMIPAVEVAQCCHPRRSPPKEPQPEAPPPPPSSSRDLKRRASRASPQNKKALKLQNAAAMLS